jgi:hypothetical protein
MGCTHGHLVPGAVVPGVLPVAVPGAVAGARAFFFLVRVTKFLLFLDLAQLMGCVKKVFLLLVVLFVNQINL